MRGMKISTLEEVEFFAVGLNENSSRVLHEIMPFTKQQMKISAG
jgi:hypothetical protein